MTEMIFHSGGVVLQKGVSVTQRVAGLQHREMYLKRPDYSNIKKLISNLKCLTINSDIFKIIDVSLFHYEIFRFLVFISQPFSSF